MAAQNQHQQPGAQEPSQNLRTKLALLQQELASASDNHERLRKENAEQAEQITGLSEQLDYVKQQFFKRMLYGPKSERHLPEPDPNQGNLFEEPEAEVPPATCAKGAEAPKVKKLPVRHHLKLDDLPPNTPVEKHYFEPDEDTSDLKCVGEEVTRFLEVVPSQVKVVEWIRKKYIDPKNSDRGVIMADLPARVIDKGMAGPGMLTHMVNSKYVYHIPLNRQQRWFKEQGLKLSRSTMGDMVARVAWNLKPLYEALTKEVVEKNEYLQVDETTL